MNEEIRCRRCNEVLCTVVFDGQTIIVGRAEIYSKVRLFCICQKSSWMFIPSTLADDDWTPTTYRTSMAIRRSLARAKDENTEANDA
jgi:hypothetical protein